MIKIAYCIPGLYSSSGMERVLTNKVNYLAKDKGYSIYIITTEMNGREPYFELHPSVKILDLDINFDEDLKKTFFQKTFSYIQKQREYKNKLTQCLCNLKPDITISLLRREIDFLCNIPDGSKKIGEIHFNKSNYRELDIRYFPKRINVCLTRIWRKKLVKELKKLSKFVVLTYEDQKEWNELTNTIVIPNHIKEDKHLQSSCIPKDIISVGRYTHQKGFDLLIKAWKIVVSKHADWKLNVFGNGNKSEYQKLASECNVETSIKFNSATKDIFEKYAESSIFVLSSRFEGFGMVLVEAMSCGLPCVSFACPCGPKDIINDGIDGLLVPNGDIATLADKICYLIENEEVRIRMGQKAKENIKRFSEENVMKQWQTLFDDLLSE